MMRNCSICRKEIKNPDGVFLKYLKKSSSIRKAFSTCVPEINLHLFRNTRLCATCTTTLIDTHDFQNRCRFSQEIHTNYLRRIGLIAPPEVHNMNPPPHNQMISADPATVDQSSFANVDRNQNEPTPETDNEYFPDRSDNGFLAAPYWLVNSFMNEVSELFSYTVDAPENATVDNQSIQIPLPHNQMISAHRDGRSPSPDAVFAVLSGLLESFAEMSEVSSRTNNAPENAIGDN